jgi:hypothetical protein
MRIEIQVFGSLPARNLPGPVEPTPPVSLADAGVQFDPARDVRQSEDGYADELTVHVVPSLYGPSTLPAYIKAHYLAGDTDLSGVTPDNLATLSPLATGMVETPAPGPNYLRVDGLDGERYALVLEIGRED